MDRQSKKQMKKGLYKIEDTEKQGTLLKRHHFVLSLNEMVPFDIPYSVSFIEVMIRFSTLYLYDR